MARGGYRMWAKTDRFQADYDLRQLLKALAEQRKTVWNAIMERKSANEISPLIADVDRLKARVEEAEADVTRIEDAAFVKAIAQSAAGKAA